MSHDVNNERHCTTCGSRVGPDDVYCRFCGSRLPASQPPSWDTSYADADTHENATLDADAGGQAEESSTLDTEASPTAEHAVPDAPTTRSATVGQAGRDDTRYAMPPSAHESFTTPTSTTPYQAARQRENRMWWILGAAVVIFLLICCCLLFAIAITASQDSSLQEELQSLGQALASATLA